MKLIRVYSAAGQLEAEMIKAFLEAQQIEVVLNQESVGRTMGLSAGSLGQVEVLVAESRVEEAISYLKDMFEGKYEDFEYNDLTDLELPENDDDFLA